MVMMYFDRDSDVDHRYKREQGFEARMPALRAAMQESVRAKDDTFQAAFRHWFQDVVRRISSLRPQTLRVPRELQLARGLDAQEVVLCEHGTISGTIDGKRCLLYPITPTVS
jgi:hypothetical protein